MDGQDKMLYIGAVALLVRLHAAAGASVSSARKMRDAFDDDGHPMARLSADFNQQGFGVRMVENGPSWIIIDAAPEHREPGAAGR